MEKLMTEVDLSGNKTFRLQLKRLLSKGLWGSSSLRSTMTLSVILRSKRLLLKHPTP